MFIVRWDNGSAKLLVSDKITACGETNVSWVLYVKFRIEEHSLVKLFAFLKNVCYQYFYFVPFFVLFCFVLCFLRATDWPTTSFLGMYFFPVMVLINFV